MEFYLSKNYGREEEERASGEKDQVKIITN